MSYMETVVSVLLHGDCLMVTCIPKTLDMEWNQGCQPSQLQQCKTREARALPPDVTWDLFWPHSVACVVV